MTRKPDDHQIVAVHLTDRVTQATRVQQVFTDFGANIKTRIGLHETDGRTNSANGLILLEMVGAREPFLKIIATLNAIEGVEAKSVVFEH